MTSQQGAPRVIVLTGASSGIGRATARELFSRGHRLVLAARRAGELTALARELDPSGSRVIAVPTDVTEDASRRALIEAARAHFGQVDVLINNAGVTVERGWWWDDPDPLRVLRVNLEAPIELTRLVLPEMRARGEGHIVNIGSVAGRVPFNGMYSASKFGLRGFSQALRREVLGTGVHVSLVSPGFVRSEMTRAARLPMPGPKVIARAVADVLDRPRREVIAPGAYRLLVFLDSVLPGVMDRLVPPVFRRRYAHRRK
ncbi:SDR family NAD(P)-dependent oxidoreductase [Deinococcus metallilatus]|uniref:SDR family NAD(P)-dependent oxidoreductase n=1 Tax=Deinococcus metallilatus TaxID=1211322 RepID=A0AAJ5JZY9_9DEIO|nr:SDR family NAD(P)-dependent oxidoreductase [Deinococcus metallilatus]MBB5295403.1 short-subunit dehydrogenase [Deinococcus metallilatus]QBY08068.1 SDR family NAD(P)-dependent oxidoreductase [Deinococcus metallilatus]RXJ12961.1 SDR family NAD(P)-dependent oxidoreductase [Deinococcus metallilatus]TLK27117.1 SDR family NAD(P)-dependent oxidoreductase [Deinococcus metallilatus]GMA16079.1 short-chain dehydrogenase [Deinococcus metallilatus]